MSLVLAEAGAVEAVEDLEVAAELEKPQQGVLAKVGVVRMLVVSD